MVQRGATAFELPRQAVQATWRKKGRGKMQASSRCQSLPQLEEQHRCRRLAVALVLEPPLCFLLARSFISSLILPYFSRRNSGLYALAQDMSYRNSKACDAGLAFDLARTLGPTAPDGGCLPITATLLLFPPINDLPVLSVPP